MGDSGALRFQWSPSFDFQGDGITYDFALASSTSFSPDSIVSENSGSRLPWTDVPRPPSGTYYWRVLSRDDDAPEEHWQEPFVSRQEVTVP